METKQDNTTFYKLISYLFHPVAVPIQAVILYFVFNLDTISTVYRNRILIAVFILTYLIPIIYVFLLKNLGIIKSIHLSKIDERKRPLFFLILMHSILVFKVFSKQAYFDLYVFFIAVIATLLIVYVLLFFKQKISLHLLGLGGIIGFYMALSLVHKQNYLLLITVYFALSGIVATARLALKTHSTEELYLGFIIGICTQFVITAYMIF